MRVDADVNLIHAGQVIPAVCIDLSSSGMQVQAPRAFQIGDKLSVRIDSDHAALKGLEAEPRWCGSMMKKAADRNWGFQSCP
ncbi:Uncharacterized protein AC503_2813 [Pseudomonas syringae pv. maculicola]|nr:Uncharacterized protein AC503_2813 [Pseudomonas syringae pv. maculicola]